MQHQHIELPDLVSAELSARYAAVAEGKAIETVRRFRSLRVLVIGDAMLDTYLEGTASRLCSEGPVPVVSRTGAYRIPGGAANVAANLRALGARVLLLSVVGKDIAGGQLREALQACGVDDRWLVEDEDAGTLHKLRILADGQYVVRFDEGGAKENDYTPACQQRLLKTLEVLYRQCDLLVISDYCYGVLFDALIARLQALHAAQPKALLIDSKALHRFKSVHATVVTPNLEEAQIFVERMRNRKPGNDGQMTVHMLEQTGKVLLECLACDYAAITLGAQGVFLLDRQSKAVRLPAHPVAQVNNVGAGDSFASALALALAAGADIEEAACIGIDAAEIAVSRPRTAIVRQQELLQRVSLRQYAASAKTHTPAYNMQVALARLAEQLEEERRAGRTIVFTNGVFDILHAGHVQFLRQARSLGDVLVVGINSDRSARRLKGNGRPINSERDRMTLVAALDVVDHVVLFNEDTPANVIRALRPHLHVKGGDYAEVTLPEAEVVHEVGGQTVILPLAGSESTSGVIDRIVALAKE
ncbi:MAG: D-glycero-beta-D-manno-heptose 1-phosphate adenylyltransferase [Ktedonobacteraceae bacterium]|nr:D-glycero-beta-D-manno-heptose 1-phosphate adenylyltransferase [Ktedonobacteraceae bacterium]